MDSNVVILREKSVVDEICEKFCYDVNIRHLLYLVVPAFVIKYGIGKENLVINTFREVRIFVSDDKSEVVKAYYSSILSGNGESFSTSKLIVINNYEKIGLVSLLDNLVHEFNHAVNSYNNEIRWDDKIVRLRTGLTFTLYDRFSLKAIGKDKSYILEEIINTRQTEEIIDIIKGFDRNNGLISNTIYAINNETGSNYSSKAYYLESYICKKILDNRTFLKTLEGLRITGDVEDIEDWFDNICGNKGSYDKFIGYLSKVMDLEIEVSKGKLFRKMRINRIRDLTMEISNILEEFNSNCHYL